MTVARVCLLLVIFINVCPDSVPGQPIFGELLSWLYDYDDDDNSTSTDYDDWGWLDWTCSNCNRRRTTTRRPATTTVGPRPGTGFNLITQDKMNITVSNEGSLLTFFVSPWSDSSGTPASSTTAAPGSVSSTSTTTTAAPTTTAATTTPAP